MIKYDIAIRGEAQHKPLYFPHGASPEELRAFMAGSAYLGAIIALNPNIDQLALCAEAAWSATDEITITRSEDQE